MVERWERRKLRPDRQRFKASRTAHGNMLAGLAILAASTSIAALLLEAVGWIRMPYTVSFVTLPGLVLLVVLLVVTGRSDERVLSNRLLHGVIAGVLGLVGYDASRWLAQVVLPTSFDAFYSMNAFGSLITGLPQSSGIAIGSGWAYHITNGVTFGVIYAIIAGPARWWWGLVWGFVLEIGTLVVYPSISAPADVSAFIIVSVVGHAFFGAIVGRWCETHTLGI